MTPAIEIEENRLVFHHKKTPVVIQVILVLLLVVCFFVPFLSAYLAVFLGDGLHFRIVIWGVLLWIPGYFILRIILWNTYGREILELTDSKIRYLADYKFFKDGEQELETERLEVELIQDDPSEMDLGRLLLKNKTNSIETVLQSNVTDLKIVEEKLQARYSKN